MAFYDDTGAFLGVSRQPQSDSRQLPVQPTTFASSPASGEFAPTFSQCRREAPRMANGRKIPRSALAPSKVCSGLWSRGEIQFQGFNFGPFMLREGKVKFPRGVNMSISSIGSVTNTEILQVGPSATRRDLAIGTISEMDANKNGTVSIGEYVAATLKAVDGSKTTHVPPADKNSDSSLSLDELSSRLTENEAHHVSKG